MKKKFTRFIVATAMAASVAAAGCAFAACGEDGTKTYEGEYHYNSYNTDYGVKVKVTVKDEKISKVEIVDSDYVRATSSWENASTYTSGETTLLKKYEGKTVAEVKAATAAISGQDSATENSCDSAYLLTSCTQSSARLLKAVQNALSKA